MRLSVYVRSFKSRSDVKKLDKTFIDFYLEQYDNQSEYA